MERFYLAGWKQGRRPHVSSHGQPDYQRAIPHLHQRLTGFGKYTGSFRSGRGRLDCKLKIGGYVVNGLVRLYQMRRTTGSVFFLLSC